MSEDSADLAERALRRRKREDSALFLPVLGVILLVSPALDIAAGGQILGVPASFTYVFLIWAGLILLTRALARRLMGPGDG